MLGSLPKGAAWIRRTANAFRRQIEAAVLETNGELTPLRFRALPMATRHEGRVLLAGRWLRLHGEGIPLSDRLSLLKTIGDATDARDRCLKLAGLDRLPATVNPWASLHAVPDNSNGSIDDDPPNATDAKPEAANGIGERVNIGKPDGGAA